MNCTNLNDIISNAAPYVIFGIVVTGFAIVGIIKAINANN